MLAVFAKKFLYPLKSSYWSMLIFMLGCFTYFSLSPFNLSVNIFLHITFFTFVFIHLIAATFFNQSKDFFFGVMLFISYILVNNIKREYGILYWASPSYCYLSVLFPITFLFIEKFHFSKNFFSYSTVYMLLCLLTEYAIIENLCMNNINLFASSAVFGLNNFSSISFLFVLIIYFVKINRYEGEDYLPDFFMLASIFLAFLLSVQTSAISLFFLAASIIMFSALLVKVYIRKFFDISTGAFNWNTYIKHEKKDFPLKYSVSVTRIDNYRAIRSSLGFRKTKKIMRMVIGQIAEDQEINGIYRIDENVILIVFYNKDRSQGFDSVENIRRKIATDEYILKKSQKAIKLTITSAIAERRRSDFEASSIVMRAYAKLKDSLSENVTLKA